MKYFLAVIISIIILTPVAVYASDCLAEPGCLAEDEYESEVGPESEKSPLPAVFITVSALNLRPTPCTSNLRLALAAQGSRVEVTDFGCGEWFAVVFNGIAGYMYAAFLAELPSPVVSESGEVELLDWSVARNIFSVGTIATIVDVRTGLSYQVINFSNGSHADVRPLTAADTATMLQTYSGRWSWNTRPIWVIVDDRILAASISGMPHGDRVNTGNNMYGHVCIHFLGSRTHNGNRAHERDHQNAVMEAFYARH